MDLIRLHTNACIEHSSFSQSAKAIYSSLPVPSHVTKTEEEEQHQQQQQQKKQQNPQSLDEMLTDLSPSCFILTPSWVSKSTKERIKILNSSSEERRYPLIVVRVDVNLNLEAPPRTTGTTNDESFLNKFASLKIGTSKETGERTSKSSHATDVVYTAISQIIAREVMDRSYPTDAFPSKSATATATTTTTTSDTSGNSQNKGMFRRVFGNASSAITSLMASYDLVEDSRVHMDKWSQDDDEADDAIAFHHETIIDEDDAGVYQQPLESSIGGARTTCNSLLSEEDIIWSVDIFIQCLTIITNHAEQVIRQKEEDGDEVGLTAGSDSSNGQGLSGIILNRYGDKPCSFPSLCREAGNRLKERSELGTRDGALAGILLNLRQGPVLEIILSCLLQTNKAKLSVDEDAVIVCPMAITSRTMVEECKIAVNEVDIAIFKISSAITTLERRTEKLENQANEAQKKALGAKQMGNIKLALLYMKRRQMFLKEIENCSGSMLNLDSGLNSIQRARNDAEVLKTYELMNSSMKAIRQDSDLEKVDDIMIELEENREDLDYLHKSIYESNGGSFSDKELEEELAQLMDHDDGGDAYPECTNDSNAITSPIVKEVKGEKEEAKLEEELAQLMDHVSSPIVKEIEGEKEEAELSSQIPLAV